MARTDCWPSVSAFSLALLALPASGADLERECGVLGASVSYELEGTPLAPFAFLPSLSTGPTPLAFFDPADPRVLDVGLDLVSLLVVGSLDPLGEATISFPLPPAPALQGLALHAQFVEITLFPSVFGDLSNVSSFTLGAQHTSFDAIGENYKPIFGHRTMLLDDGRVLFVAGYDNTDPFMGVANSVAVYDPQTETTAMEPGTLFENKVLHTLTRMPDGRVLIIGGADETATPKSSCDLYDPATGQITPIAPMGTARAGHTATLLPDGRVFVAGGVVMISSTAPLDNVNFVLKTTELYDPVADSWSAGPDLPLPRMAHAAVLLPQFGWVLLIGGLEIVPNAIPFLPPIPLVSSDCRRYVPAPGAAGSLIPAAPLNAGRLVPGHLVLDTDRVFVAGGGDIAINLLPPTLDIPPLASTEEYDPIADTWTPKAPLNFARSWADVMQLPSGELLVAGGNDVGDFVDLLLGYGNFGVREIETGDAAATAFAHTGTMQLKRLLGGSSVLIDGGVRMLTAGEGEDGLPELDRTIELYNP